MNFFKIIILFFISSICFSQDRFEDIKVPHYGPYFKQWEEKARKGDPLAMLDLFEWTEGIYNANTDLPLSPVGVCAKWQPNAGKLILQKVKELADQGDVAAMRAMGFLAHENPEAKAYLQRAASTGDPYAILAYGSTFKYGNPQRMALFERASKILLQSAKGEDRRAMFAVVCEVPRGVLPKETVETIFNEAVKGKDFYSGIIYYLKAIDLLHYGNSTDANYRINAMDWLEQAARLGEIRAMLELGQIYYHGGNYEYSLKVPKNLDRAWYWARAYRAAVGCPSPDVDPPRDEDGKPWKRPPTTKVFKAGKRAGVIVPNSTSER